MLSKSWKYAFFDVYFVPADDNFFVMFVYIVFSIMGALH